MWPLLLLAVDNSNWGLILPPSGRVALTFSVAYIYEQCT